MPTGPPARPLQLTRFEADPGGLWRVYRGSDPTQFSISTAPGGNRFDPLPSPWASTRVLYLATAPEAAIAETLLRWHDDLNAGAVVEIARAQIAGRSLIELTAQRALTLIDLTGYGLAAVQATVAAGGSAHRAEGITQCSSASYGTTQGWGGWFRDQVPEADGFGWMSRQFNSARCVVLFEDRCDATQLKAAGTPQDLLDVTTDAHRWLREGIAVLGWTAEF